MMITKIMLTILCIVIFLAVPVMAGTLYTPTTETVCTGEHNQICTKTLYSGTRFIREDNQWKPIEKARSLKNIWKVAYLETEKDRDLKVIDFNYTSITVEASTSALSDLNNDINLYKRRCNETDTINSVSDVKQCEQKENIKYNPKQTGKGTMFTMDYQYGDYIQLGDNSIVITLQDADTEVLEDSYVWNFLPNTNFGSLVTCQVAPNDQERIYIKFNISSLPTGATILDSNLRLYKNGGSTGNISVHEVFSHYDWNEDTITWNNQPCGSTVNSLNGSCNSTYEDRIEIRNLGYYYLNITKITKNFYNKSVDNLSVLIKENTTSGTVMFYSKDYTTATYLKITYIAPLPTINNYSTVPSSPYWNSTTTVQLNVSKDADNEEISWCNFTVTNPDGVNVIDNVNGTKIFGSTSSSNSYNFSLSSSSVLHNATAGGANAFPPTVYTLDSETEFQEGNPLTGMDANYSDIFFKDTANATYYNSIEVNVSAQKFVFNVSSESSVTNISIEWTGITEYYGITFPGYTNDTYLWVWDGSTWDAVGNVSGWGTISGSDLSSSYIINDKISFMVTSNVTSLGATPVKVITDYVELNITSSSNTTYEDWNSSSFQTNGTEGQWNISVTCMDSGGQTDEVNWTFTVTDNAPVVSFVEIQPRPIINENVSCVPTASDAENNTITYYYLWFKNNVSLGITTKNLTAGNYTLNDNLTCQVIAEDTYKKNSTATNSSTLTVGDVNDPILYGWYLSNTTVYTVQTVWIFVNCTDDSGFPCESVTVEFLNTTNNNVGNQSMTKQTNTIWNLSYIFNETGNWTNFTFWAKDQSGNNATNITTLNLTATQDYLPVISEWSLISEGYTDTAYTISVNCNDTTMSVQDVYVTFYDPYGNFKNETMTLSSGITYTKSYTFSTVGTWTDFTFYCSDEWQTVSNLSNLVITLITNPGDTSSSGGPGSVTIIVANETFDVDPPEYRDPFSPGKTARYSFAIYNTMSEPMEVEIYLSGDESQEWYNLESSKIIINATSRYFYYINLTVPEDALRKNCIWCEQYKTNVIFKSGEIEVAVPVILGTVGDFLFEPLIRFNGFRLEVIHVGIIFIFSLIIFIYYIKVIKPGG